MTDGGSYCWGDDNGYWHEFRVMAVSAGYEHDCWIASDGTVGCNGSNRYGQSTPSFLSSDVYTSVSAGERYTCGVTTHGAVVCWGGLYDDDTPPEGTFKSVSVGENHACALRTDGSIVCWGYNGDGRAFPPRGVFQSVSAGGSHTCGIKSDGSVVCWGFTHYDDGTPTPETTPPQGSFKSIAVSYDDFTCGVRTNGAVVCWGDDYSTDEEPPEGSFQSVSAGYNHACGLRTDGSVVCWQRGGYEIDEASIPPDDPFRSVSVGKYHHSCGVLRSDRQLICWDSSWGHSGYGESTPPKGSFISVSAGGQHTCGVRTDGHMVCGGSNESGQAAPP